METIPQEFIMLENDGFSRVILSKTPIGKASGILAGMAKKQKQLVKNIASFDGMPIHAEIDSATATFAVMLKHLTIDTHFALHEDGSVYPVYRKQERCLDSKFNWIPPKDMELWFICVLGKTIDPSGSHSYCFLLARKNKATYKLPLPNLHEDGRICMGGSWSGVKERTMIDFFISSIQHFQNGKFNADLLKSDGIRSSTDLFSFNSSGGTIPPRIDWVERCQRVNVAAYEFLGSI